MGCGPTVSEGTDGCPAGLVLTYVDVDYDGIGDADTELEVCGEIPEERVLLSGDCDDENPDITPGRGERCDGIDNNCDGQVDEYITRYPYFADIDEDGFGDPNAMVEVCTRPDGYLEDASDCDDNRADVSPASDEVCDGVDNDCDGLVDDQDEDTKVDSMLDWYPDEDADGYGDEARIGEVVTVCDGPANTVSNGDDCNDADPARSPAATEVCGGGDENCNGFVDDQDPGLDPLSTQPWYIDADGDTYGDPLISVGQCLVPIGYVSNSEDCDDSTALLGLPSDWYVDSDGDGFGFGAPVEFNLCVPVDTSLAPDGGGLDCDDARADVNPSATEICDDIDNDCDSLIDDQDDDTDPATMTEWHDDRDGDGYGHPSFTLTCLGPGQITDGTDCDDNDPGRSPGMTEVCDGDDENCNGLFDDSDPTLDRSTQTAYFQDADGDLFGDPLVRVDQCLMPDGYIDNMFDCDDSTAQLGLPADWYADFDGDGYGDGDPIEFGTCVPADPTLAPDGGGLDCDDAVAATYPGAPETCGDGIDSDCDGVDCNDFSDDFESGAFSADWTMGGNQPWQISANGPFQGAYFAENGNINDNQQSTMQINLLSTAPGTLTFWHSGSTESNYDFLRVRLDGVEVLSQSGTWGWTQVRFSLVTGPHTVVFEYDKDGSVSTGADTVYIDLVEATNAATP